MVALLEFWMIVRPFWPRNENWKLSHFCVNSAPFQRKLPPHVVFQPSS